MEPVALGPHPGLLGRRPFDREPPTGTLPTKDATRLIE
jgi:hypothetical protein